MNGPSWFTFFYNLIPPFRHPSQITFSACCDCRCPSHTSAIHLGTFVCPSSWDTLWCLKRWNKGSCRVAKVHKVAKSFTFTLPQLVLTTTTLPEIRHGRQLGMQRSHGIPSIIQRLNCSSCFCFVFESRVHVSEKVVTDIVAHNHFLEVSVFRQFNEEIFIKPIKIRLELFCRHILTFGCVARVIVDVGKEDGLWELRLDVFSWTSVAVSAGTNLQVERTVDTILFCTEDVCEMGSHYFDFSSELLLFLFLW